MFNRLGQGENTLSGMDQIGGSKGPPCSDMEHNAMPATSNDDVARVPNVNWPANLFNDAIEPQPATNEAPAATRADFWRAVSATWTGTALRLIQGKVVL
jgi:hypothetical protein